MRFPLIDTIAIPCVFERLVPGALHPDGRRYLPLIILRPTLAPAPGAITPADLRIGVVDRHHLVAAGHVGRAGVARLVFALSALRLQQPPHRSGLAPEDDWLAGRASLAPALFGQVCAVAAWEQGGGELPYQTLYTEMSIDSGVGVVGLRTSITAEDMATAIGTERVAPGDWVELRRSRIDILAFDVYE
ncbi:MAG: hypothetical protein WCJ55_08765 [Chloroflexales bacterium]